MRVRGRGRGSSGWSRSSRPGSSRGRRARPTAPRRDRPPRRARARRRPAATRRRRRATRRPAPTATCPRGGGTAGCSSTRSSSSSGEDAHGAGVLHELAAHGLPVAEVDGVATQIPHHAGVEQLGRDGRCARRPRRPAPEGSPGQVGGRTYGASLTRSGVDVGERHRDTATSVGRRDQTAEQRVRLGRARAQLGVGLGRDVVRVHVARQLDELDQTAVRRGAGEPEPGLLELARGSRC